jgi:hypothetical protein
MRTILEEADMSIAIRYGVVVCAVVLGACSDGVSGPDDRLLPLLNADLAQVAADAAGEDVEIMREPVLFPQIQGGLGTVGAGDLRPVNCPFNPATQRLECPVVTMGGTTITRSYAFWDAANAPQQQFDPVTTATANIATSLEGDRSHDGWSASVSRERNMTATGLAGAETQRTWNGTGSSEVTRSRHTESGENRSYEISCELTVSNVVVPLPGWPLSGTISRACSVTFTGGPRDGQTVQRTAVITFNGTQRVPLTVGDKTFEVDLANRRRR